MKMSLSASQRFTEQIMEGFEQKVSQSTRSRKRQINNEEDDDNSNDNDRNDERVLKRARLTRKNLARFNKMVGTRTSGGPAPASIPLHSTATSSSAKPISTTSPSFDLKATKNGMLNQAFSKPPTNLENIHSSAIRVLFKWRAMRQPRLR
ncbi:hypothetical protein ONZ43_g1075 [Nemania bipapillata]|uniref:Uncharacterized protein n=1 Tax=Nemania bipapillata TaxID=110536 RepID=A0ACC2J5Q6_9PEZI|nr:hypothetical protein ONZ43_g1075 [Nemania bipapillata]